jgi:hypothetical protein
VLASLADVLLRLMMMIIIIMMMFCIAVEGAACSRQQILAGKHISIHAEAAAILTAAMICTS